MKHLRSVLLIILFCIVSGVSVYEYSMHTEELPSKKMGQEAALPFRETLEAKLSYSEDSMRKTNEALLYVNSHHDEAKRYIEAHNSKWSHGSEQGGFAKLLGDYTLLAVGDAYFPNDTNATGSVLSTYENYLYSAVSPAEPLTPFTVSVYGVSTSTHLVAIDDLVSSGAYNINTKLFFVNVTDTDVVIHEVPRIREGASGALVFDDETVNIGFDSARNEIQVYGMRPFGAYPCNRAMVYRMYNDRFIFSEERTPTLCVGYDYSSRERVSAMPDDADFSVMTVTKKATASFVKKAEQTALEGIPKAPEEQH